jgi:S-phase kinase-associated protein 1
MEDIQFNNTNGGNAAQVIEEIPPNPPVHDEGAGTSESKDAEDKAITTKSYIKLTPPDGVSEFVSYELANKSELIKTMMEDEEDETEQEIPLPNVPSAILKLVILFLELDIKNPLVEIEKPIKSCKMEEIVSKEYADFLDIVVIGEDKEKLFKLILAANYLDIKSLLDLCCAKVATMIKGKNPEEIRSEFDIVNDFTPEEEAQIREENRWCEEA